MNEEQFFGKEQTLDRAIVEIREMPVLESPGVQLLFAQIPIPSRTTNQPIPPFPFAHRNFIMRHAYQLTTAAAIALLAVGWLFLASPVSIALADVIQAATNYRMVSYTLNTSATFEDSGEGTSAEVVYVDLKSPRFRTERHDKTLNETVQSDWVTVHDYQQGRMLLTSSLELIVTEEQARNEDQVKWIRDFTRSKHAGKKARLIRVSDRDVNPFTTMPFTYTKKDATFLEILRTLQNHKDIVATKDTLHGQDTMKYQLDQDDMTLILWVDVMTKLPVRIEQELRVPRGKTTKWKCVLSNFGWDVDVKNLDQLFSTEPPAD